MIWVQGFPKDTGASDLCDSARLAGMAVQVKAEMGEDFKLSSYIVNGYPVRCPINWWSPTSEEMNDATDPKSFSRDQLVQFVGGLRAAGDVETAKLLYHLYASRNWICLNGDWINPSVRLLMRVAAGMKPSLFQWAFLYCDCYYFAKKQPLAENNQMLSILLGTTEKQMKRYIIWNPKWSLAVKKYWADSYRKEPELAAAIIRTCLWKAGIK